MSKMNRSFAQRGTFVEVSTTVEKEKLTSKDVLETISKFRDELANIQNQRAQAESQIKRMEQATEHNEELLKDIGKFEEWAKVQQQAKVEGIVRSLLPGIKAEIEENYVHDPALTDELNKKQQYQQLQHKLATHAEVKDEIYKDYITEYIFEKPCFEDPFQ